MIRNKETLIFNLNLEHKYFPNYLDENSVKMSEECWKTKEENLKLEWCQNLKDVNKEINRKCWRDGDKNQKTEDKVSMWVWNSTPLIQQNWNDSSQIQRSHSFIVVKPKERQELISNNIDSMQAKNCDVKLSFNDNHSNQFNPNSNYMSIYKNRHDVPRNSVPLFSQQPLFYQFQNQSKSIIENSLSPFSSIESQMKFNNHTYDASFNETKKHIQIGYEDDYDRSNILQ